MILDTLRYRFATNDVVCNGGIRLVKSIRRLDVAQRIRSALAAAPVLVASATFAASQDEHREHGAHEHGHGNLDIVVEGEELVVELRIPAANVVGFEYAPRDDAEREAIRKSLVPFQNATAVLMPSVKAQCEVEEVEAHITSMSGEVYRYEDEHHGKDEHGHEGEDRSKPESASAGHEHDHEEDDEHEKQEPDSDAEAHSEMHAAYHFHCHAPEQLDRIEVSVFEYLLDAEEIAVRVVTPAAQMAMELHPGDTVVELAQ